MSFFAVTVQKIEKTWPIEGADAIELAKVCNYTWQFVVRKGEFAPGDIVAYFPLDAIIPMLVLEKLGMVGKFAGARQDRIKTREFRGQKSQGFVCRLSDIYDFIPEDARASIENTVDPSGLDITAYLGVTKYEPQEIPDLAGNLLPLPDLCHGRYDIEGCDNFPAVVDLLMDDRVIIFEKLEGKNSSVGYDPIVDSIFVSQRNYTIHEIPGHQHDFWKVAREQNLIDTVQRMYRRFGGRTLVRSEMVGPGCEGNIYRLNKQKMIAFDIMLDDKYVDAIQFLELCAEYGMTHAPILAKDVILREWLAGRTIDDAATGESALAKILREGIVIKPMVEKKNSWTGRTIIKQRSAKYLGKKKE